MVVQYFSITYQYYLIVPVRGSQERKGLSHSIGTYEGRVIPSADSSRSAGISFQAKESAQSPVVEGKTQNLKQEGLGVFFEKEVMGKIRGPYSGVRLRVTRENFC